jgi:hypothetical protein
LVVQNKDCQLNKIFFSQTPIYYNIYISLIEQNNEELVVLRYITIVPNHYCSNLSTCLWWNGFLYLQTNPPREREREREETERDWCGEMCITLAVSAMRGWGWSVLLLRTQKPLKIRWLCSYKNAKDSSSSLALSLTN